MTTSWAEISKLVSDRCSVPAHVCEAVLRAFQQVTGPEEDEDCELMNAFHSLVDEKESPTS